MLLSNTENFHVKKFDNGERGLFSSRAFAAGEEIYPFDYWSQTLMPIHVTNHSCAPNATFNRTGMLVALKEIGTGEEITFDYLTHPTPASPWNFKCDCGSENCVGWFLAAAAV